MSSQEEQQALGRGSVSIEKHDLIEKVRKEAASGICRIITPLKSIGTGALYRVVDSRLRDRFLLMTCNHVLPTNAICEILMTRFMFDDNPQMASVTLERTDVKYVWNSSLLDATVIEISQALAARYVNYGAKFFEVGEVVLTQNVDVVLIQYPNGVFSIADGNIEAINGDIVSYQIGTAPGSSGSPLLNLNCVALALHQIGPWGVESIQPQGIRKATILSAVVKAYLDERPDAEPELTTRTATALLTLAPKKSWTAAQLRRENETETGIGGMAAGSSSAELFLADCANGVVRAFDVSSGQLAAARDDVYRSADGGEKVWRVAYCARTDTLFTCSVYQYSRTYLTVRSFARKRTSGRNGVELAWRECNRFDVLPIGSGTSGHWMCYGCGAMRVLSDATTSSLVLAVAFRVGGTTSRELREMVADEARAVQQRGRATLPDDADLDAIDAKLVGREIWIACAMVRKEPVRDVGADAVALCRVVGERVQELSRCPLREPCRLLFCGDDSLLVYAHTADGKGWQVHELSIAFGGGRIEPRRVLLFGNNTPGTGFQTPEWCLANDSLVAWNVEPQTFTTFSLN